MGNPANLRLQDFTIEAWIRRASASAVSAAQDPNDAGLVSYGSGGYGLGLNNNGSLYLTKVSVNKVTVAAPVTGTNWHHIAVTKAGTNVIFYVDGAAYPAPPYNSIFTFSNNLAIGSSGTLTFTFLGSIIILGATNSSLLLTNVQPAASGDYSVVISNSLNSVTSAPASLSVRYIFVFGTGQNLTNMQYTFVGSVNLQLQTFFTNGTIFYTLDGSQPSFLSAQYTAPVAVVQSSVLRVITYSADFSQAWETDPITVTVIPTYSLQAGTDGGGTVSVNPPNGPYVSNTMVNATATPSSGWTFLG